MHSHIIVAALILGSVSTVAAQRPGEVFRLDTNASAGDSTPSDTRLDSLFASWNTDSTPGCVVGVMRDGRLAVAKGYGMADLASGAHLTSQTILGVASLSKQFTAFALAVLVDEGRITLDDEVRSYVPELPSYGTPIRIRDLLFHTSGLRDYLSLASLAGRDPEGALPRSVALELIARQRGVNHEPGTAFLYSNTNYFLLALILERVSGQDFSAFVRQRLFTPLGMIRSRFALSGEAVIGQAESYRTEDGRRREVSLAGELWGDGGAYATMEDLARWDAQFSAPRLGTNPKEFIARVRTQGRFADGRPIGYGWGTQFSDYRGVATEGHGGTWGGFRAYYLRFPSLQFSTAVLCNQLEISPFQLTRRIADLYLRERLAPATEPPPPAVTPAVPESPPGPAIHRDRIVEYAGRYESDELDAVYRIQVDSAGRLMLRAGWDSPVPLRVVHRDTLARPTLQLMVQRDAEGSVTGFVLNSGRVRGLELLRTRSVGAQRPPDTLEVRSLATAPVFDGRAGDREYSGVSLRIATAAGDVRVWSGRHAGFIYLAAVMLDSSFYWGDDFVVSIDRDGSGGESPGTGDRQWYLRRVLDSSVVMTAENGRWFSPDGLPPMLGAARQQDDWGVASTSSATGWVIELRIREAWLQRGTAAPRLAIRTYNDQPRGWWSWPAAPSGVRPQQVERTPDLWVPLRLR